MLHFDLLVKNPPEAGKLKTLDESLCKCMTNIWKCCLAMELAQEGSVTDRAICCLCYLGKHFATYTRCCTRFLDFLAHFAMQLFLFLDGRLDFCRIGQIYHQSFSKKLKCRKYIPFSFAWLTHILSTAWPKANRKIRITAKIHIIWFFSLNGLLSAKNIQIYGKAESMFNMT